MIQKSIHRYLSPSQFLAAYKAYQKEYPLETVGYSSQNRPIYASTIGNGPVKVLAWSQMHGNETTTTRALLELMHTITNGGIDSLFEKLTLRVIFQLNPDGSQMYTRVNANQIDLNRDANQKTQPETQTLMQVFNQFDPDLCLNLHGQRSIFSAGQENLPASLSFLAPSADSERSVTPSRKKAMQLIAAMVNQLPCASDWSIGRYDDAFNLNCTGDYFTAQGTPTILFEAGHSPNDYDRIKTRKLIYLSLIAVLSEIANNTFGAFSEKDYFDIPENKSNLRDVAVRLVTKAGACEITNSIHFVQFEEVLKNEAVHFVPKYIGKHDEYSPLYSLTHYLENEKYALFLSDIEDNLVSLIKRHQKA